MFAEITRYDDRLCYNAFYLRILWVTVVKAHREKAWQLHQVVENDKDHSGKHVSDTHAAAGWPSPWLLQVAACRSSVTFHTFYWISYVYCFLSFFSVLIFCLSWFIKLAMSSSKHIVTVWHLSVCLSVSSFFNLIGVHGAFFLSLIWHAWHT